MQTTFLLLIGLVLCISGRSVNRVTDRVETFSLKKSEISLCSECIDAAVLEINILLNEILNGVIVQDCEELCAYLNDTVATDACDAVCLFFGVDEFINLIISEDLDPIWYCEIIDACTIDDCEGDCLTITMYSTVPLKAPAGSDLTQFFTVNVQKNWVGTGMFRMTVFDPVNGPESTDALLDGGFGAPMGNTTYHMDFDTSANGWALDPGTYVSNIMICNGECESSHPHSRVFTSFNTTFTLT